MPGEDDAAYRAWDKGNMRGIHSRFLGMDKDQDGNQVRVFEVDDAEWGTSQPDLEYHFQYAAWHRTYHSSTRRDPRCTICTAEAQFELQRAPHERDHRGRGQYDPSCRFCQDDRFFGRL